MIGPGLVPSSAVLSPSEVHRRFIADELRTRGRVSHVSGLWPVTVIDPSPDCAMHSTNLCQVMIQEDEVVLDGVRRF